MYNFRKSKKGFTLVELMVVVAIIGILALLGLRLFLLQQIRAKNAIVKANAATVHTIIQGNLADESYGTTLLAVDSIGKADGTFDTDGWYDNNALHLIFAIELFPRYSLNHMPARLEFAKIFFVMPSVDISPTTPVPDSISSFMPCFAPVSRFSISSASRMFINCSTQSLNPLSNSTRPFKAHSSRCVCALTKAGIIAPGP